MELIASLYSFVFFTGITFFIAVSSVFNNVDPMIQGNVDSYVKEFTDTSRSIGYISPENYLQMANSIYATGNRYIIEVEHRSKQSYPTEDEDDYVNGYSLYNRDEIVQTMFPETGENKNYNMKKGDFIKVNVKLASPTYAQSFSGLITGRTYENIKANYGGYVGNTKQQ